MAIIPIRKEPAPASPALSWQVAARADRDLLVPKSVAVVFSRGFVLVALLVPTLGRAGEAVAQSPQVGEAFVPCAFRGRATMPLHTPITDAGGRPIARFSGAETSLVVAGLSTATPARARIETGIGQGGFRVRGFIEARKLPIATVEDVPVVAGRIFIGARRSVSVLSVTPGKVQIEKRVTTPLSQSFTTFTTCSRLTLGTPVPPGFSPAGHARGFVLRRSALELFDRPEGSAVSVLHKAPDVSGVLFFSTEESAAWVRLEYRGEVLVDAWAKKADLEALARGETMDQPVSSASLRSSARLALPNTPRVVKSPRELPLRAAAKEGEPIGVVEAGAETIVLDVVAGWVSVLPKALDVMPVENAQFWVKKEELGI